MRNTKKIKDIKGVISREKRYSTLAKKEGRYAKKIEKKEKKNGMIEQAKDSKHEAKIAFEFAKKRKQIVSKEKQKFKTMAKK